MEADPIVEALDEGEDVVLCLGSGFVLAMMDELGLERMEEALHRSMSQQSALRLMDAVMPAADRAAR